MKEQFRLYFLIMGGVLLIESLAMADAAENGGLVDIGGGRKM
jgi:hypothetical protein